MMSSMWGPRAGLGYYGRGGRDGNKGGTRGLGALAEFRGLAAWIDVNCSIAVSLRAC